MGRTEQAAWAAAAWEAAMSAGMNGRPHDGQMMRQVHGWNGMAAGCPTLRPRSNSRP